MTKKYLEAGQQVGFAHNFDYNGTEMEGLSVYQRPPSKAYAFPLQQPIFQMENVPQMSKW